MRPQVINSASPSSTAMHDDMMRPGCSAERSLCAASLQHRHVDTFVCTRFTSQQNPETQIATGAGVGSNVALNIATVDCGESSGFGKNVREDNHTGPVSLTPSRQGDAAGVRRQHRMVHGPAKHQHQPPSCWLDVRHHLAVHHRPVHLAGRRFPAWQRLRAL